MINKQTTITDENILLSMSPEKLAMGLIKDDEVCVAFSNMKSSYGTPIKKALDHIRASIIRDIAENIEPDLLDVFRAKLKFVDDFESTMDILAHEGEGHVKAQQQEITDEALADTG